MPNYPVATLALAFVLAGCASRSSLREDYPLSRVQRIGVVRFEGDPRLAVHDLFAQALVKSRFAVVERARTDALIAELNLGLMGSLDPATAKRIGQALGADALMIGQVDSQPDRRSVVMVESVHTWEEPLYETRKERQPDGSLRDVRYIAGYQRNQQVRSEPRTYVLDAQVSITAKLVDVETGELIWAGSGTDEAVTASLAANAIARSLIRDLRRQWEQRLSKQGNGLN
jgi:hypothetical protein